MFKWQDQNQDQDQVRYLLGHESNKKVGGLLSNKSNKNEDIFLPAKWTRGNNLFTFGNCGKHIKEDSMLETSPKHNFLKCNVDNRSILISTLEFKDIKTDMQMWSDFPSSGIVLHDGYKHESYQDSDLIKKMSDNMDAPLLNQVGGIMENSQSSRMFHTTRLSPLNKACCTPADMIPDVETELFGLYEDGSECLDFDLANIEDFDNFDKMLRNIEFFDRNEMSYSTNTNAVSNNLLSIPIPEDSLNQTARLHKIRKVKDLPIQGLDHSWSTENHPTSYSDIGTSVMNFSIIDGQPPSEGQGSSSYRIMHAADNANSPVQFSSLPLQPQGHIKRNHTNDVEVYSDLPKYHKILTPSQSSTIRTTSEKIKNLQWRQQKQAKLSSEKQQELYTQLSTLTDDNVSLGEEFIEDYNPKLTSFEVSSTVEQDPSMLTSLIYDRFARETIYYQIQEAIGKLEMRVRLAICDSMFRLARNCMERQSTGNRFSKRKHEVDYESSAEENFNWRSRFISDKRVSSLPNSENATNTIDRIVAQLLFYSSSGSSQFPNGEMNYSMAVSI